MKIDFDSLPRVLGVIGSRKFTKLSWIDTFVFKTKENTIIVSGGASGADTAAEVAAIAHKRRFKAFRIEDWEWEELAPLVEHKARIAHIRNELLVRYVLSYGGAVIIFSEDVKGQVNGGSKNAMSWCTILRVPYVIITRDGEVVWNADFAEK